MIRILFVCLGNICRSPTAEGVMQHMVESAGLSHYIQCDSAGTAGYHVGDPADARSIKHAQKRGYRLLSLARKLYPPQDFEQFDYIVAMDKKNYADIQAQMTHPDELQGKLFLLGDFCSRHKEREVPDPYYEGPDGFDKVLDMVEDGCAGLLKFIIDKKTGS